MSRTFQLILIVYAVLLSGCFGLFDSGGDHIVGPYYTGWIDVHSSRYIEKQEGDDIRLEVIPAYIYAVGHNEKYIIVKQHPSPGPFHEYVDISKTNYYIIDLKLKPGQGEKGLYGPMDASQFNDLSHKLHIDEISYDLIYPDQP